MIFPSIIQNCVRHCLSLGQFFRKVERNGENTAIKGNYWEVIPEKIPLLERDMDMFTSDEFKKLTCQTSCEGYGEDLFNMHK